MSVNSGNLFSADSLSGLMTKSLPEDSDRKLYTPYDAVALLCHASMLAVGFRLIGLGEDHKIGAPADSTTPQPLPSSWNASTSTNASSPSFAFRYAHDQSSMEYLLKVSRLGSKALVNGLAVGDDNVKTVDLLIRDFLSESTFPVELPPSSADSANETALRLRQSFISAGRLTDAGSLIKLQIIQKLAPGLRKEGYEDSAHAASQSDSSTSRDQQRQQGYQPRRDPAPEAPPLHDPLRDDPVLPAPARPHPFQDDPLAAGPPRRPYPTGDFPPPGFEDEYEINRPPRGMGDGRRPFNIGERDLYPQGLGPNDPLRGGIGPGLGGGGGFGGGGGGGMHPTFDDPLFGGRGGGVEGYDPQAPPGARYDPLGPSFPRGGTRGPGGGGPPNPFGGFGSGDFI